MVALLFVVCAKYLVAGWSDGQVRWREGSTSLLGPQEGVTSSATTGTNPTVL